MEGWIKKPNITHIANSSSTRPSGVSRRAQAMAAKSVAESDDFFDELDDPFEDEDLVSTRVEDEKMQSSEAYFNQQMEEFRQKSAELQRLIDAQQAQAATTNPYMAPQGNVYGQAPMGQNPYGNSYGQAPQMQANYGQPVQAQNPYMTNPYSQNMYAGASAQSAPQAEPYPRYPYPAPQMQPGMGQMPQAGVDGVVQTPVGPEPLLQTMDLSGIIGELEQVVNAGVSDIKSNMSTHSEVDVTGIQDGMGSIQAGMDQMRDDIGTLQTGFESVKSDVSSLRSDMSGLSQTVSSATADLSNIQEELTRRFDEATRSIAEETRQTLSETKSTLEEATRTISQNTQSFEGLKEQLEAITDHGEKLDGLTEQVDDVKHAITNKIHEENVKEFRNIKQTIDDKALEGVKSTDSLGNMLESRLEETERKLKEQSKRQTVLLVFAIVDFLGVIGILLLQSGIIK